MSSAFRESSSACLTTVKTYAKNVAATRQIQIPALGTYAQDVNTRKLTHQLKQNSDFNSSIRTAVKVIIESAESSETHDFKNLSPSLFRD